MNDPILRDAGRCLVALFVLWHMAAVALYSLPYAATDPLTNWLRTHASPHVQSYVLSLSQWQQWNLFSPDPLRRVTTYVIETQDSAGNWNGLAHLKPGSYPWYEHATRFKFYGNMLEGDAKLLPIKERFLQLTCAEYGVLPATPVRLLFESYVIPQPEHPAPASWWRAFVPQPVRTIEVTTVCPAT